MYYHCIIFYHIENTCRMMDDGVTRAEVDKAKVSIIGGQDAPVVLRMM